MVAYLLGMVWDFDPHRVQQQWTRKGRRNSVCGCDASCLRDGASSCCHRSACRLESNSLLLLRPRRTTSEAPLAWPWRPARRCLQSNCEDPLMQVDTPNRCVCRKSEHEHGVSMLPDIYHPVRALSRHDVSFLLVLPVNISWPASQSGTMAREHVFPHTKCT